MARCLYGRSFSTVSSRSQTIFTIRTRCLGRREENQLESGTTILLNRTHSVAHTQPTLSLDTRPSSQPAII